MNSEGHTAGQWGLDRVYVCSEVGATIADCGKSPTLTRKEQVANATLIVTAVNTYPAVEGLVKALEDWLYYAEENLSEFDYEDCHAEKLCHRCESSGCINLKIRNARNALSRFRSLQKGGVE